MSTTWTEIKNALDDAERNADPIGTKRMCSSGEKIVLSGWADALSIAGLPGLWVVRRAWEENGIWIHDIERVR